MDVEVPEYHIRPELGVIGHMMAGLLTGFVLHSQKAIRCRYSVVKRLAKHTVYRILFLVVRLFSILRRPVSTLLSNRPALSPYSWYTVFSTNYLALLLRTREGRGNRRVERTT